MIFLHREWWRKLQLLSRLRTSENGHVDESPLKNLTCLLTLKKKKNDQ